MTKVVVFSEHEVEIEKGVPSRVLAGRPETRLANHFTDTGGKFFAGVWDSSVGKWEISYSENEFCHLLEGVVELTDKTGSTLRLKAGDAFVIPAGFEGTWETVEPARKYYAIYEA